MLLSYLDLSLPDEVSAHCTTNNGHFYAAGGQSFGSGIYVDGVSGKIEQTKGQMCTSGVSHSITLLPGGNEFLQTGWRYYAGYSSPKMYCEGKAPYFITEFSMSSGAHTFRWELDGLTWECSLDLVVKDWTTVASIGFSRAASLNAQGEAHQNHVQIGRMDPGRLLFSNLKYRRSSTGVWTTENLSLNTPPPPYKNDEPQAGQMRVWTVAH